MKVTTYHCLISSQVLSLKRKATNGKKCDLHNNFSGPWPSTASTVANEKVIDMLVHFTNMYALKRNRKANISCDEIKCFLGVLLVSGYSSVSRRRMYWENSEDSKNILISNAIRRDRFEYIMSNIHCCDNDNLDKTELTALQKSDPYLKK
ncbi:hypothetical protein NQ318_002855 [Aromia moschata]|uniref:PiggyBac transposable element-derived protein domain-containing protein n=1 Tax=Aromia moschata TaxID=1265417 RepID=A0AAV8XSV5_9CUCU|nr:hypothetical protein NQ318_002855 [Aromia moschata]